jgi:muconolactone delta-isomerase
MNNPTATEATELDTSRRYLVPVARLDLPNEPDLVHVSLYSWHPRLAMWITEWALCGTSVEQGALPNGTAVTCPGCTVLLPKYQAILDAQAAQAVRRREQDATGDTVENGAWHTVWLESGKWRWVTSKMTTEQREYAADCVAAYSRYLATVDGDLKREEPSGLRWWREGR